MNDHDRLKQLHDLTDRLERLPASPKRDWMLNQVRARAVDVETGVRPDPLRPLAPDDETAAREVEEPKRRDPPPSRAAPSPPRAARAVPFEAVVAVPVKARPQAPVAASDDRLDLLERGGELCLGDPPAEAPEDAGHAGSPPWARGLRG